MTGTIEFPLDPLFISDKSKEELIDEYLRLRKEYEKLKQENEALKKQVNKPAFIKIPIYKKKKRWKKLGRPAGHPGCTRPKPEIIHHVVEQKLEKCPDCGQKNLNPLPTENQEHIQEDIVPARVEATKFIRHAYWCCTCKQQKTAPYASHEVPGLPSDNNHAERMIRPNVIFRKISFQNMSHLGANVHEVLMSLLQTLLLQDKNPVEFFKTAYLRHRQGNSSPLLFLPAR